MALVMALLIELLHIALWLPDLVKGNEPHQILNAVLSFLGTARLLSLT
jgi:hypothetical protein